MPSEPHTTLPEQIQDLSLRSEQQETVTMPAGETREAPVILDVDEAVGSPWIIVSSRSYTILNEL